MARESLLDEITPWMLSHYIFYSTLLLLKLMSMQGLMIFTRIRTKVLPNPEDYTKTSDKKPESVHPLVERVRKMHQNDLENILPFFLLGLMSCFTMGSSRLALLHFRTFFAARMITSLSHYFALQPFRSLSFMVAIGANISMAGHLLYKAGLSLDYF